jgi:hypothetical protein
MRRSPGDVTADSPRSRREATFIAVCVGAMLMGMCAIARADAPRDVLDRRIDLAAVDYDLVLEGIAEATDAARAEVGLDRLRRSPALERAAMEHAARMAELGFYDHTDPYDAARRGPSDRARLHGVQNPMTAENIHDFRVLDYDGGAVYPLGAPGQFSHTPRGPVIRTHSYRSFGRAVVAEWLASPGHRRNLLDREARAIGYGAALHWQGNFPEMKAVQLFQLYESPREAVAAAPRPAPKAPSSVAPEHDEPPTYAAPSHVEPAPRRTPRQARRLARSRLRRVVIFSAPAAPAATSCQRY